MSFCLRPNVCKKCGKPLTMFEGWICLECEKAERELCDKCAYSTKDGYCQYDDISETIPPLDEHWKCSTKN